MKKCRSRIIFNRENETSMTNEIGHNHSCDSKAYNSFVANASFIRRFGENKKFVKTEELHDDYDDDMEK